MAGSKLVMYSLWLSLPRGTSLSSSRCDFKWGFSIGIDCQFGSAGYQQAGKLYIKQSTRIYEVPPV